MASTKQVLRRAQDDNSRVTIVGVTSGACNR
jgi:hypothetical protein